MYVYKYKLQITGCGKKTVTKRNLRGETTTFDLKKYCDTDLSR